MHLIQWVQKHLNSVMNIQVKELYTTFTESWGMPVFPNNSFPLTPAAVSDHVVCCSHAPHPLQRCLCPHLSWQFLCLQLQRDPGLLTPPLSRTGLAQVLLPVKSPSTQMCVLLPLLFNADRCPCHGTHPNGTSFFEIGRVLVFIHVTCYKELRFFQWVAPQFIDCKGILDFK